MTFFVSDSNGLCGSVSFQAVDKTQRPQSLIRISAFLRVLCVLCVEKTDFGYKIRQNQFCFKSELRLPMSQKNFGSLKEFKKNTDYNGCGEAPISERYLTQRHREHGEKGGRIHARLPDRKARIGQNCRCPAQ